MKDDCATGIASPSVRSVAVVGSGGFRACLAILLLAGCTSTMPTRAVPELAPGIPTGYLSSTQRPDSLALLPPPPAADSAAFAQDEETHRQASALRDTSRWRQAILDADLHFPQVAGTFSCALGAPITSQGTPRLYQLLQRSLVDVGLSTQGAKTRYRRTRPFVMHGESSCTPQDEPILRKDGSYPSGHTTIGWAWALILAEVDPDRADAILARGRSFGESRLVCNVHWQSDVLEGRFMGAATVARLHGEADFREDIVIARKELAAVRAQGLAPGRDCTAEAEALSTKIPGVL